MHVKLEHSAANISMYAPKLPCKGLRTARTTDKAAPGRQAGPPPPWPCQDTLSLIQCALHCMQTCTDNAGLGFGKAQVPEAQPFANRCVYTFAAAVGPIHRPWDTGKPSSTCTQSSFTAQ